jgi:hypothetical protein
MLTLLAGLIAITCLVILIGGVYAYFKVRSLGNEAVEAVNFYLTSPSPDSPSPLLAFIAQVSEITAQKIGMSTQMAIKGSLGGTMKGINAQLEQEAIASDPSLALTQALPKSLRKNPIAMIGLQALVNKFMASSGAGHFSSNNHEQTKFNL